MDERYGPLAAFLLGLNVAARMAEGTSRDAALDGTIAAVQAVLPPASGSA